MKYSGLSLRTVSAGAARMIPLAPNDPANLVGVPLEIVAPV
jgi:hypothetical protein